MDSEQRKHLTETTAFGNALRELGSTEQYNFTGQDLLGMAPGVDRTFLQRLSRLSHTRRERVVTALAEAICKLEEERYGVTLESQLRDGITSRLTGALEEDLETIKNRSMVPLILRLLKEKTGLSDEQLHRDLISLPPPKLATKWWGRVKRDTESGN